ncbi:hypothetical protein HDU87_006883 [Geranomyces variabilis]|uniref:Cytochrome P450 n=1 Tax=Geranomyces variabilis TaxID=109894 RepID=A0AAD5XNP3_9FUNG|nr:hypothetical protein HDU87_006883 [Geranomyces variabilis]
MLVDNKPLAALVLAIAIPLLLRLLLPLLPGKVSSSVSSHSHSSTAGLLGRPRTDAPGFKGLPIIGNALMLADYVRTHSVIKLWVRVSEHFGPVASFPALFLQFVIVADHHLARWILATPDLFGTNMAFRNAFAPFSNGLLVLPAITDTWKTHRKLVAPVFSVKHLRLALDVVHARTDDLIAFWLARHAAPDSRPANVHAHLTAATFDMIGGIAFSYNPGSLKAFADSPDDDAARRATSKAARLEYAINQAVDGSVRRAPLPGFLWKLIFGPSGERRWRDHIAYVRSEVRNIMMKRTGADSDSAEQAPREGVAADVADVLDRLLAENKKEGGKRLSDEEVIDEVLMFFLAGHETTANTLVWTLLKLTEYPAIAAKLRAELDTVLGPGDSHASYDDLQTLPYLAQVIKEVMRVHPVAATIPRQLLADTHIGGYFVGKGTIVNLNVTQIHVSRAVYGPDAHVFRPERWEDGWAPEPGGYVPFGHGPKGCIGEKLALMELKAILSRIVKKFDFDIVLDQALLPVHAITVGLKHGLLLRLKERNPGGAAAEKSVEGPTTTAAPVAS